MRERWLNGWVRGRNGHDVYMWGIYRCVGCGVALDGVSCSTPPTEGVSQSDPDWPFDEANCPLCYLRNEMGKQWGPLTLQERLAIFKARKHSDPPEIVHPLKPNEHHTFVLTNLDLDGQFFVRCQCGWQHEIPKDLSYRIVAGERNE